VYGSGSSRGSECATSWSAVRTHLAVASRLDRHTIPIDRHQTAGSRTRQPPRQAPGCRRRRGREAGPRTCTASDKDRQGNGRNCNTRRVTQTRPRTYRTITAAVYRERQTYNDPDPPHASSVRKRTTYRLHNSRDTIHDNGIRIIDVLPVSLVCRKLN